MFFSSSGFRVPVAERAHLLFLRGKIVRGITTTFTHHKMEVLMTKLLPPLRMESVNQIQTVIIITHIYPTPSLGQDMTQGQFLSRV